jgi:tetratricopeptide (TPR) repeat protein
LIVHLRANWGFSPGLLELAEEAVALARQSGDDNVMAYALCSQAAALLLVGEFQSAHAAAEEALALWRSREIWGGVAAGSIWAAKAAMGCEDWIAAEAHLDQTALHLEEVGSLQESAVHDLNRARLRYRQGLIHDALRLFVAAEEAFTGLGDRVHAAAARVGQSACLVQHDQIGQAAELMRSAEDSTRRLIRDPRMLFDGLGPSDFRERLWSQVTPSLAQSSPA